MKGRIYRTPYGETLKYRIHLPREIKAGQRYPLLLLFHGAGERGADNRKQLVHGVDDILRFSETFNEDLILLAPQCPNKMQWVNTPWEADSHMMPEYPSLPMKLAIELVKQSLNELPVDPDRVYVVGLSMGGYGAWDIIQRQPELFAAAMPICGGGDPAQAEKLTDIAIWCFHDDSDSAVKVERSREMVEAIKCGGGNIRYTEYKGVDHNSWSPTFADDKVLHWLFAQAKA